MKEPLNHTCLFGIFHEIKQPASTSDPPMMVTYGNPWVPPPLKHQH